MVTQMSVEVLVCQTLYKKKVDEAVVLALVVAVSFSGTCKA